MSKKGGRLQSEILKTLAGETEIALSVLFAGTYIKGALARAHAARRRIRDRDRFQQSLSILKRNRLVESKEVNGEEFIVLTEGGKKRVLNYKVDDLALPREDRWDRKWRIIIFDVPERLGAGRRALSKKLKDLGAYPLQKSVFTYPYPCQDEVDFISEFFQIGRYVRFLEASSIEGEEELLKFFSL